MNPNLPPRPFNHFQQVVNPNLPPRPFNHFQQPMNQSSFPRARGMPQPRRWQPRKPVRPPQEIKVLDNSAFVAERTSERRQLHFLHRPITLKASGLARRSFVDTEEQIQTILEPLLHTMDTGLRDESSEESEERLNNSFRTLWSERTEMRAARKRIVTPPAHSLEPEENYIENPAAEPMDISDDYTTHEPMQELPTPRVTKKRGVTAVKTSNYAQRQTNHPPPDNLLLALERVTHLQLAKLPFLRRNLKTGFIHAFVRHYSDRDRPLPKISRTREKRPINVRWMYTLKEQGAVSDPQSVSWAAVQDSWRCQLCNTFHSFKSGNLLLFHLRRDHNEVVTRLRKLTPGHWLLQVDLSNAEIVEE